MLTINVLEFIIKSKNAERNGQIADYYQFIYNCLIAKTTMHRCNYR